MTRVDFYHNAADKAEVARRLASKAYAAGQCVLLYTRDDGLAQQLDGSLWTQRQLDFIPHVRCGHPLAAYTPVLIGDDPGPLASPDLLVNLAHEPPACFGRFERVIEVVGQDEEDRQRGRARYRFYRDQGYDLKVVDLAGTGAS